jgi:hypothetical protein
MRNFNKVEFSDAIFGKSARLRFSDIPNPTLRFLHRWMSFMLFPMAEYSSVTTPELKSLFAMVHRIKYIPVANIVDYFRNVHKMSGPIQCTSMVTWIAMNHGCPEMANLAYIARDVPVLGLDHFVHTHILREDPDHSLFMLYGRKVIRLPNPALRLYSCEGLTLQFDRMGSTPQLNWTTSYSWVSSHGGSTIGHDYIVGSPSGAPVGQLVWGWLLGSP